MAACVCTCAGVKARKGNHWMVSVLLSERFGETAVGLKREKSEHVKGPTAGTKFFKLLLLGICLAGATLSD